MNFKLCSSLLVLHQKKACLFRRCFVLHVKHMTSAHVCTTNINKYCKWSDLYETTQMAIYSHKEGRYLPKRNEKSNNL